MSDKMYAKHRKTADHKATEAKLKTKKEEQQREKLRKAWEAK